MTVTNCTITGYLAVPQSDWADNGADSDMAPLTGTVSLRPVTVDRKPLAVAPDYDPPAVFAQPVMAFTGVVEDGVLKTVKGGDPGLRVPANDEVLGLEQIWYRIDFDLATGAGQKVVIEPQYFEAPSTDTTADLSNILTETGSTVTGVVRQAGYTEDILDSGPTGREVVRAVDQADAWEALGVAPTENLPSFVTDSTAVGRALETAVDEAAARTAIDFTEGLRTGIAAVRTHVDLQDVDAVRAANWSTFLGANFTSGQSTISNAGFTAADIGKIVIANLPNSEYWKSTITSVANGVATVNNPAPQTVSGGRIRYGFDGTSAIQAALNAVGAQSEGVVAVYLGGNYRVTTLNLPPNVLLMGVPFNGAGAVQAIGNSSKTVIAQLPGAECDLITVSEHPTLAGTIALGGMVGFELRGPEVGVVGVSATVGHGVNFATAAGVPVAVQDGFIFDHVSAYNFPGSGFRSHLCVPMFVNNCKALYNGRFGWEHQRYGGGSTILHFFNFSADWNNLGAVGIRNTQFYDAVFFTNVKSEGHIVGEETATTRGGPNLQSRCLVLDGCDNTLVLVNGVHHIRVARAEVGPGPSITICDTEGSARRPRVTYNAVMTRVLGSETGSIADAVTIRDQVNSVDIPRTVVSGHYPTATAPLMLNDIYGNRMIQYVGNPSSVAYFLLYNSPTGGFPLLGAGQSGADNVGIGVQPKGNAPFYITVDAGISTAQIRTAGGGSTVGLDISTKGGLPVTLNSVEPELTSRKGQANGYAPLDSGGKVAASYLPSSAMEWQGVWNANTNTPTLIDGTGSAGDVYRVSVAGTRNLGSGSVAYSVGDLVIYDGAVWQRSDSTDAVTTVNGYSGTVTLTKSDVGLGSVDNTADNTKDVLSASKLTTARTLQTDLTSTSSASFDGTGNVTPGVTGTLPVSSGGTGATTLTGLVKGSGTSAFAAATAGTDYADPSIDTIWADSLTTGQSTIARRLVTSSTLPSTNGVIRLTYFTARKSETVTQVRVPCGATASAGSTLQRIGLYSIDGSGNLTLVASTPNDTALWASPNTGYTKAFSASYALTRGTRYAIGLLVVGTTTAPTFMGTGAGAGSEFGQSPRLAALLSGKTDLDASVSVGSLTDTAAQYYMVLLP